jgi:hypothetical protein
MSGSKPVTRSELESVLGNFLERVHEGVGELLDTKLHELRDGQLDDRDQGITELGDWLARRMSRHKQVRGKSERLRERGGR